MKNEEHGVPDHTSGIKIVAEKSINLPGVKEASEKYALSKERLLNVNHWDEIAGKAGAVFQLIDQNGQEVNRSVQKGDFFKIDIPGPGSKAGDGYDWVQVEDISERNDSDSESIAIRVRPASDPLNKKADVAHFYSEESTSTFKLMREKNTIKASIHDTNTKPNTNVQSTVDKIRNTAVATSALAAFSKIQWSGLANGILED